MNDDITVVISNYNYGRFLFEAVESADAHVVVVDDGSTDPLTLDVLDELSVPVVRQENSGVSAARNAGLRESTTPFVLCLDADDRLAPGALDALRAPLDANPDLGFSYGFMRFFGDWDWTWELPQYDPYKLLFRHQIGPTGLMRRELVEATGGFDASIRHLEDWEIWINALAHGFRGERVPVATHEYRKHGVSKFRDDRRFYREWYRRIRAKHKPLYGKRGELARETGAGALTRAAYELYWAWRPLPARLEGALQSARWAKR
jgi:glycosyltransferase involved in cell wall biosynthesis